MPRKRTTCPQTEAALDHPDGCTTAQLAAFRGLSSRQASKYLGAWAKSGSVFQSSGNPAHYFSTAAARDAYEHSDRAQVRASALLKYLQEHGGPLMVSDFCEHFGRPSSFVSAALGQQRERGRCVSTLIRNQAVWWPTREAMESCDMDAIEKRVADAVSARAIKGHITRGHAIPEKRAVSAPVTLRDADYGKPQGEADYSQARITVCPSINYDPRYQVDPEARPFGAGFSAVGIGRSVTTGGAWA